jgi:hypothetical protein
MGRRCFGTAFLFVEALLPLWLPGILMQFILGAIISW